MRAEKARTPLQSASISLRHEAVASLLQEQGIVLRSRHEYTRMHTCNHAYFYSIDTEEKAYWLGFFTADGCVTTGNRVNVTLGIADYSHLAKLKTALNATHKISTNSRYCTFVIRSPEMATDLASHGIFPTETDISPKKVMC